MVDSPFSTNFIEKPRILDTSAAGEVQWAHNLAVFKVRNRYWRSSLTRLEGERTTVRL